MHERIEAIAARSPEALAVSDARGSLTYAELNARANQLARLLLKGHGDTAAPSSRSQWSATERSATSSRCLRSPSAGGASVPIDPSFPDQRILHLLGDSSARVVIAAEHHHQRITGSPLSHSCRSTTKPRSLERRTISEAPSTIVVWRTSSTPPVRQGSPRSRGRAQEPGKPHCMAPRRLRTRGGRSRDAHRRGGVRRGNLGALAGARRRR